MMEFIEPTVYLADFGLTALIVGSLFQGYSSVKQASAQKKAMKAQMQADRIKQRNEKRQAIRDARIKRASIIQAGENQGASESSAVAGGAGSIQSQLAGTTSFLDQVGSLNAYATKQNITASTWGNYGQLAGLTSQTAFTVDRGLKGKV